MHRQAGSLCILSVSHRPLLLPPRRNHPKQADFYMAFLSANYASLGISSAIPCPQACGSTPIISSPVRRGSAATGVRGHRPRHPQASVATPIYITITITIYIPSTPFLAIAPAIANQRGLPHPPSPPAQGVAFILSPSYGRDAIHCVRVRTWCCITFILSPSYGRDAIHRVRVRTSS